MSEIQTPLTQSSGLSRDKRSGAPHWRSQRVSALLLAPLMLWFIFSVLSLVGANHSFFVIWLSTPINTFLMASLVTTILFHSLLGMKVIVEDYIHDAEFRNMALIMLKAFVFICFVSSLSAIFLIVL